MSQEKIDDENLSHKLLDFLNESKSISGKSVGDIAALTMMQSKNIDQIQCMLNQMVAEKRIERRRVKYYPIKKLELEGEEAKKICRALPAKYEKSRRALAQLSNSAMNSASGSGRRKNKRLSDGTS